MQSGSRDVPVLGDKNLPDSEWDKLDVPDLLSEVDKLRALLRELLEASRNGGPQRLYSAQKAAGIFLEVPGWIEEQR